MAGWPAPSAFSSRLLNAVREPVAFSRRLQLGPSTSRLLPRLLLLYLHSVVRYETALYLSLSLSLSLSLFLSFQSIGADFGLPVCHFE